MNFDDIAGKARATIKTADEAKKLLNAERMLNQLQPLKELWALMEKNRAFLEREQWSAGMYLGNRPRTGYDRNDCPHIALVDTSYQPPALDKLATLSHWAFVLKADERGVLREVVHESYESSGSYRVTQGDNDVERLVPEEALTFDVRVQALGSVEQAAEAVVKAMTKVSASKDYGSHHRRNLWSEYYWQKDLHLVTGDIKPDNGRNLSEYAWTPIAPQSHYPRRSVLGRLFGR